jgi:uncharacterized protein (DUF4415 family)
MGKNRTDADNPALSDRMLAKMRPAHEVVPGIVEAAKRRGRPPVSGVAKEAVKLRIDRDVIAYFRSGGAGWQTRMNDALRRSAKLGSVTIKAARPGVAAARKRTNRRAKSGTASRTATPKQKRA